MATIIKSIQLSPEAFHEIPDNPVQRDTIQHALKHNRPGHHLYRFHPTHLRVSVAQLPDKRYIKLDGHTRSWLWHENKLELPPAQKLFVDVYQVKNEQQAIDYYLCFDADGSHETANDKLYGAFRYLGFRPHNKATFYRNIGMLSAIRFLIFPTKFGQTSGMSYIELIKPWVGTLRQIDTVHMYNNTRFPAWVTTAMLMTVRYYGKDAVEFWKGHHDDAGTKHAKTMDGIYMMNEQLHAYRNPATEMDRRRGMRRRSIQALTPRALRCLDWYANDKRFPIHPGKGTSNWDGLISCKDWWEAHFDGHDHPELRSQAKLPLGDDDD